MVAFGLPPKNYPDDASLLAQNFEAPKLIFDYLRVKEGRFKGFTFDPKLIKLGRLMRADILKYQEFKPQRLVRGVRLLPN